MWQTEMILILRHLINDLSDTPTYTDDRLTTALASAAQVVTFEVNFDQDYSIDILNQTISPDPTDTAGGTRDNAFIALVTTKAACRLAMGEAKIAGGQALSVKDGSSAVDLRDMAKYKSQLATNYCKDYQDMKWEYETSGSTGFGNFALICAPYRFSYNQGIGG